MVELIARNITLNLGPKSSARALPHAWGTDPSPELGAPFDTIVMADVVYDPATYELLVRSLVALSHPQTEVLLAHRERHPDNALFFTSVQKHFRLEQLTAEGQCGVWNEQGEEEVPASERQQHGSSLPAACSDVHVLRLTPLWGAGTGKSL